MGPSTSIADTGTPVPRGLCPCPLDERALNEASLWYRPHNVPRAYFVDPGVFNSNYSYERAQCRLPSSGRGVPGCPCCLVLTFLHHLSFPASCFFPSFSLSCMSSLFIFIYMPVPIRLAPSCLVSSRLLLTRMIISERLDLFVLLSDFGLTCRAPAFLCARDISMTYNPPSFMYSRQLEPLLFSRLTEI